MSFDLVMQIAQLALSLVQSERSGNATTVTATLLQIVQKGAEAYEQQTGAAIDPSLIRVETTV